VIQLLKISLFICIILTSVVLNATPLNQIAAIVNDDVITTIELEQQVDSIKKQLRTQQTRLPPEKILRKQVLEREIVKQIQLQLAQSTGIRVDDSELSSTLNRIADQNQLSLREFRRMLEKDGFSFTQFRNNVRAEMILARLRQREVTNRITISDQEIGNFLSTQAIQGNTNEEYKISHILISVPEAANASTIDKIKLRAESVLARIENGENFQQVAISSSDGQKALEGGNLGWRKSGQLPTLFSTIVTQMENGEHSELIRSSSGFHIIILDDKRISEKHVITQTNARHILLHPNELNTELDIITRLRQLRQRIIEGADFAELAKSHSEDRSSAVLGGDLGWVNPGQMVPQFEMTMNSLNPGDVSEPFQSQFGWHIVQVLERRNLDNSEEFAKNNARKFIQQRKIEEMTEAFLRQIREEAFVDIKLSL